MDLFEKYLLKKDTDELVKRALTDSSFVIAVSNNMAFYNSNYSEILDSIESNEEYVALFDKIDKIDSSKLNDKNKVIDIAKKYNLLKYIDRDTDNPTDDYILKAIKSILYVIYKKTKSVNKVNDIINGWYE